MIPPNVIAPQVVWLREYATLCARGLVTWDDALAVALPPALAKVRRSMPASSESGLRAQLASILGDAERRHIRAMERADEEIRSAIRAMIRGPQVPTEDDPHGRRRPTSAELLAEARAVNARNGAPFWTEGSPYPTDEVGQIVDDEILFALRRQKQRRAA